MDNSKVNQLIVCSHPKDKQVVEVYGDISHQGGELVDTLESVLVCADCGATIDEEELADILF